MCDLWCIWDIWHPWFNCVPSLKQRTKAKSRFGTSPGFYRSNCQQNIEKSLMWQAWLEMAFLVGHLNQTIWRLLKERKKSHRCKRAMTEDGYKGSEVTIASFQGIALLRDRNPLHFVSVYSVRWYWDNRRRTEERAISRRDREWQHDRDKKPAPGWCSCDKKVD